MMLIYSVLSCIGLWFVMHQFPMIFRSYQPELMVEFSLELL